MVKFKCRACCGRGSPLHKSSPSSWLGARSIILCPLHFRSSYLTRRFTVANSFFHHSSRVCLCHTIMRSSTSLLRGIARSTAPRTARIPRAERIPAPAKRLFHTPRTSAAIRPSLTPSRARIPYTVRFESSAAPPTSTDAPDSRLEREQVPSYELTFTCNVCKTRSSHRLSKQGYHHGTVLIQCPGCKNRHLIADHLKV